MATLFGQNLRLLSYDDQTEKYVVIAKATTSVVTLTNNVEQASHKDIVGIGAVPAITSKSWGVQVTSFDVSNTIMLLKAMRTRTRIRVLFDEVATTDNQTPVGAPFARTGEAYISDATFTFNDREISTKNLQLTGYGPLEPVGETVTIQAVSADFNYTRGQHIRLLVSTSGNPDNGAPIAAAKNMSMHVSLALEQFSTKDTMGEWLLQEPTELSYDITTNQLVRSGEYIKSSVTAVGLTDLLEIHEASAVVGWKISSVTGDNNRTEVLGGVLVKGICIITSLAINANNRQIATYDCTFNGVGLYEEQSQ